MTVINFDSRQYAPENSLQPLPNGSYNCVIEEEAVLPTKSGDGAYLQVKFKIIHGEHAGRFLVDRLNLKNPVPRAVEVGKARLSAICHAIGIEVLLNTEQLLGKTLIATIGQEHDRETKQPTGRNVILGYGTTPRNASRETSPMPQKSLNQLADDIPF